MIEIGLSFLWSLQLCTWTRFFSLHLFTLCRFICNICFAQLFFQFALFLSVSLKKLCALFLSFFVLSVLLLQFALRCQILHFSTELYQFLHECLFLLKQLRFSESYTIVPQQSELWNSMKDYINLTTAELCAWQQSLMHDILMRPRAKLREVAMHGKMTLRI